MTKNQAIKAVKKVMLTKPLVGEFHTCEIFLGSEVINYNPKTDKFWRYPVLAIYQGCSMIHKSVHMWNWWYEDLLVAEQNKKEYEKLIKNKKFSEDQDNYIRRAINSHLDWKYIKIFAHPEYDYRAMEFFVNTLRNIRSVIYKIFDSNNREYDKYIEKIKFILDPKNNKELIEYACHRKYWDCFLSPAQIKIFLQSNFDEKTGREFFDKYSKENKDQNKMETKEWLKL